MDGGKEKDNEFQLTRPAWGRGKYKLRPGTAGGNFNSHAPHGGAAKFPAHILLANKFQLTRPAWGRGFFRRQRADIGYRHFNSHAPHGGAALSQSLGVSASTFQLTRPAWGRGDI